MYFAWSIHSYHVSKQVKYLLLGMMLLSTFFARAGMDPQGLKETVSQRLGITVYLVDQTPIAGLYMLGTSQGVLYSDAKGDYLLQGIMLDMTHDMKNLTVSGLRAQRLMAIEQIGEPRIQLNAAHEIHKVTLFIDDACPSCQRVLEQLPHLQKMGVSVQLLPVVASRNDVGYFSNKWCNNATGLSYQFSDHLPAEGCSEILSRYVGLSQWFGIKTLPSWVLPNGDLVRGYQSPKQLLKILDHLDAPANPSPSQS